MPVKAVFRMFRPSLIEAAAGAIVLAAVVGSLAYLTGRNHENAAWVAKQAEATQRQIELGNEASDEVRNLTRDCLSGFLAGRVPDGCP